MVLPQFRVFAVELVRYLLHVLGSQNVQGEDIRRQVVRLLGLYRCAARDHEHLECRHHCATFSNAGKIAL